MRSDGFHGDHEEGVYSNKRVSILFPLSHCRLSLGLDKFFFDVTLRFRVFRPSFLASFFRVFSVLPVRGRRSAFLCKLDFGFFL